MNEENLNMIINTLKLRMKDYSKDSDAYRELQNTINMLEAKCYRENNTNWLIKNGYGLPKI